MKLAFILALAPLGARAVCPNSCSSKGTCGAFDQCTCDFGYKASDCSQRMCAQGPAWITTPKGDLNSDLDTLDYTVYQADARFTSQTDIAKLVTQESPGGDWESWPGFATAGEAHFYMECSNRGLCNYEDGLCECFEGYEGYACNRMACPNDCSGHGSCQTAKYLTKYPSTVATNWYTPLASADYKFWDGEMALSCSCDAGYAGADCSLRQCPRGDDILTTVDQVYETQFIDIYTKCAGTGSGGDAPSGGCAAESATAVLGGSIRLTYTDHFGEEYTTDLIPGVAAYGGPQGASGLAANAEAALKALPNNAISNDIEVTATYCEVHQAKAITGIATTGVLTPAVTGNPAYRIVSGAEALTEFGMAVITTDGTSASAVAVRDAAITAVNTVGDTVTVTAVTTETEIATLTFPKCIRLVVNFNGMAGDLPDLKVDTSEVTYAGYTNAQSENSDIASSVSDTIVISSEVDGYTYVAPTSISVTSSSGTVETETSCSASATSAGCTKITLSGVSIQGTTTTTFYPETKVEVYCGGRSLGQYKVIEADQTNKLVFLQEVIPASTIAASCTSASVTVTSVTQFIVTGSDDGTTDNGVKLQNAISGHSTSSSHKLHVSATYDVDYNGGGTDFAATMVDHASYAVAAYEVSPDSGSTRTNSIVILDSTMLVTAGKNSASAAVKTILSSEVPALAAEINSGSETWASLEQNVLMVFNGKGTMEAVECGSRGLCDTEAGECKCFSGYTGVACETQSAISM